MYASCSSLSSRSWQCKILWASLDIFWSFMFLRNKRFFGCKTQFMIGLKKILKNQKKRSKKSIISHWFFQFFFFLIFISKFFNALLLPNSPMILAYDLEKPFCPNNDEGDICVQEVFSALLITLDMILCMNTAIFK